MKNSINYSCEPLKKFCTEAFLKFGFSNKILLYCGWNFSGRKGSKTSDTVSGIESFIELAFGTMVEF